MTQRIHLTPAQERMMTHARSLAALGPPFSRVPQEYRDCFLASDLLSTKYTRITTLRALIRKGHLHAVVRIVNPSTGKTEDIALRILTPQPARKRP